MSKPTHQPPRDFDFLFGDWTVHNRRLRERLAGSDEWESFDAVQTCRPILDGMGNQDEMRTDAFGDTHYIGMSLRLFDPRQREWAIYWMDNRRAILEPPVMGRFKHGIGTFLGRDICNGTPALARYLWTADADRPRWEQAFSTDEGQTWETNWIMDLQRRTQHAERTPT